MMEEKNLASFPRPVFNRIPNFKGAETASDRLCRLPEFKSAGVVKVNPDSPQRLVRYHALKSGKTLVMPSPRLRQGFLLLDSNRIPPSGVRAASSIRGAFRYGQLVDPHRIPRVELVVLGSVAVDPEGARLGKGEGYGEIEYGVLRELGVVEANTKVVTSVHDAQIVKSIPLEAHDVPVDIIVTPTKVIRVAGSRDKPKGIIWDALSQEKISEIQLLRRLQEKSRDWSD